MTFEVFMAFLSEVWMNLSYCSGCFIQTPSRKYLFKEHWVKYVQSLQNKHKNDIIIFGLFWYRYVVSIVDFEQVNSQC